MYLYYRAPVRRVLLHVVSAHILTQDYNIRHAAYLQVYLVGMQYSYA